MGIPYHEKRVEEMTSIILRLFVQADRAVPLGKRSLLPAWVDSLARQDTMPSCPIAVAACRTPALKSGVHG